MSLINQMLRDLEQRNTSIPKSTPADPTNIALMREQSRSGVYYLVGLVGLLSLTAGWLLWDRTPILDSKPESPSATAEPSIPTTIEKTEPEVPSNPPVSEEQTAQETESLDEPVTASQETVPEMAPIPPAQADYQAPVAATSPAKAHLKSKLAAQTSASKPVKSRRHSADALYRQADNSASRMMRKENLHEVLEIDPRHLPARQKLLGILLQERSPLELKTFLDESLALFPTHLGFITALAHYHVQHKEYSSAIATLERIDDFPINDIQYLSLLAASYQQQQHYAKALPIYQKLSRIQPEKAENWLGLGICADKLQQHASAAQAYQRALQRNSLSNEVVDYIKQRLSALNY